MIDVQSIIKQKSSTCVVTGGAGFIGSHLSNRLAELNCRVLIIDDLSSGSIDNLNLDDYEFEFFQEDICDRESLDLILRDEDIDVIFHLAAIPRVQFSIANPHITNEVNIGGTLNILSAAHDYHVDRVVFASSSSVYGEQSSLPLVENMRPNPMSPYALQKMTSEYYCKLYYDLYGLKTVSLRYFNCFGPKQDPEGQYATLIPKVINKMLNQKPFTIHGDGNQTRDFNVVENVVEATILAGFPDSNNIFGKVYNIGSSVNRSVNFVISEIKNILIEQKIENIVDPIHGPAVIEPRDTRADISLSQNELQWEPLVSFEEGLKRTVEHAMKERGLDYDKETIGEDSKFDTKVKAWASRQE